MRLVTFAIFTLLFSFSTFAQTVDVQQTSLTYEKDQVAALQVTVNPGRDDLQDAFDGWMDDNYDIKMRKTGWFGDKQIRQAEGVTIPAITTDRINFFTKTVDEGENTTMHIFASRGLDNYLSASETRAFDAMEQLFDAFLADYLPDYYQTRVDEAVADLNELQEELEELREDHADNEEEIKKLQASNEDLDKEIKDVEQRISEAQQKVNQRRAKQRLIETELGSDK